MENTFIPVILGMDINAFGIAASFHEYYGINSIAVGKGHLMCTENLPFLKTEVFNDFDTPEIFVKSLNELAERSEYKNIDFILFPCSDGYTELLIKNKDFLNSKYKINTVNNDMRLKLENKKDFYETCEKYGLPYPDTFIVSMDKRNIENIPFDYPVIAKPNNSIKYFETDFPGYKKAYKADSKAELEKILTMVYSSGYDDDFIIQDYIPGGTDTMYVVNAYVNSNGKVGMTCAAHCILDECYPAYIGNYNALITGEYNVLTDSVKNFLEKIGYRGYANFDFKYDKRDNTFKIFDMNLRTGRSSYFMAAAGNHFVKYLTEDLIFNNPSDYENFTKEHLWYFTHKRIVKNYCPKSMKDEVKRLFKENKATFMYDYYGKYNIKRREINLLRKLETLRYYPKYEKKPIG